MPKICTWYWFTFCDVDDKTYDFLMDSCDLFIHMIQGSLISTAGSHGSEVTLEDMGSVSDNNDALQSVNCVHILWCILQVNPLHIIISQFSMK